jgi:hypothetical protein
MLEEIRVLSLPLIEQLLPVERMPALRAARLDQSAEVVIAQGAKNVLLDGGAGGHDGRRL